MRNATLITLLMLALLAGVIALQVRLARRQSRWPGLVLPGLSFLYSLLVLFQLVVPENASAWDIFAMAGATFLTANIPTLVLLFIYFLCKERQARLRQLEKMNIQDLN